MKKTKTKRIKKPVGSCILHARVTCFSYSGKVTGWQDVYFRLPQDMISEQFSYTVQSLPDLTERHK